MGRDTIQLENVVSTISKEYLLEFTSEYGIPEGLQPELPGPKINPSWNFQRAKLVCTPKMDLFNLISAPNPTKVKTRTRPLLTHEFPLLTATAGRVIEMEIPPLASGSSRTLPVIEKLPLDFANEDPPQLITKRDDTKNQVQGGASQELLSAANATTTKVGIEPDLEREVAAMGPLMRKRRRKRGSKETEANAPAKVLRKDHATARSTQSTLGGKSIVDMVVEASSTFVTPTTQ
ncbi:hypothetical protein Tco_1273245 [Tanacetum coccineum]